MRVLFRHVLSMRSVSGLIVKSNMPRHRESPTMKGHFFSLEKTGSQPSVWLLTELLNVEWQRDAGSQRW